MMDGFAIYVAPVADTMHIILIDIAELLSSPLGLLWILIAFAIVLPAAALISILPQMIHDSRQIMCAPSSPSIVIAEPVVQSELSSASGECAICMEGPKNACLMPCGHLGMCLSCAKKQPRCPLCMGKISTIVQVYTF